MVNPSNAYSDIGDFSAGENGWWFGKPEAGHVGLQQKLSELGVEVIHRGTTPPEESEYAPEAGAAYYNETSEVLHLGDGTAWNAQATWGKNPTFDQVTASNAPSAATDVVRQQELSGDISPTSVDTVEVSSTRVLDTGDYAIGMTKGYATYVDPADYADDSAAIQALNDELVANMSPTFERGVIRIPALKPDGSQWSFPSTVTLGETDSNVMVALQGTQWGDGIGVDPWTTTITDGSPVFHIAGDIPGNSAAPLIMPVGGFFMNGGQGQDVEALRVTNVKKFQLRDIKLQHFAQGDISEGAVVFEGSSFNSEVDRVYYTGFNTGTAEAKKTDVFKYVSRTGVKGPGEIVFGPGVRARQGYGYAFNDEGATAATSIYWHGHSERWEQDYAFNITVSSLRIGNDTIFGHPDETSTGGNVLNFTGAHLSVSEGADMGAPISGAHSIYIGNVTSFHILPFNIFGGNSNVTAIVLDSNPNRESFLPDENHLYGTLNIVNGNNVRFPDGAKPGGSGTFTLVSGGQITGQVLGGNQSYDPVVRAIAQADPGAVMELDKRVYYDGTVGNWKADFSWATDPGVSVTFDYVSRFYDG